MCEFKYSQFEHRKRELTAYDKKSDQNSVLCASTVGRTAVVQSKITRNEVLFKY